jgi:hypothetical protein
MGGIAILIEEPVNEIRKLARVVPNSTTLLLQASSTLAVKPFICFTEILFYLTEAAFCRILPRNIEANKPTKAIAVKT